MDAADKRLREAWAAGFMPYAMLFRDEAGITQEDWRKFQRLWARPAITATLLKDDSLSYINDLRANALTTAKNMQAVLAEVGC